MKESLLENKVKKKDSSVFNDRSRTNILIQPEQKLILYLLKKVPDFITSNMLTGLGLFGNCIVLLSFILGNYIHREYLLLGIPGLALNWLGDSLDGRLAYYRNNSRKWYGFTLDIVMDWVGIVITGIGFIVYAREKVEVLGFLFVVLYGWAMINALLKYKITNQYIIDSGKIGPTELRIIIAFILVSEVLFQNMIVWFAAIICLLLLLMNWRETLYLLELGNQRDKEEKSKL